MSVRSGLAAERRGEWIEYGPADLGLSAVDLKTLAATNGTLIDVSGFSHFFSSVVYTIAGTAPVLGTVVLKALPFASDASTQLAEAVSIVTISSIQAAGTYRVSVGWGDLVAAAMKAYGSGGTFTLGNPEQLRCITKAKFQLDVTTAYDQAGAKSASVYLLAAP